MAALLTGLLACSSEVPGEADSGDLSGDVTVGEAVGTTADPAQSAEASAPGPADTLDLAAIPGNVAKPRTPLILAGSCPGECCVYGDWLTGDITQVYARPNDTSEVAFTLTPRKPMTARAGYVRVDSLGTAVLESDGAMYLAGGGQHPIPAGDTVVLLGYQGEGYYHVWYDGRVGEFSPYDSQPEAKVVRDLAADWWVEITSASGDGWLWMEGTPPVWGADGCGMPGPPPAGVEPCSRAWVERVEQAFPIGDAEGHGPDLGSDEWMSALARRLGLQDDPAGGSRPGSGEWCASVDRMLWGTSG